jgi:4'-phosphopantetheinyl transferase
LNRRHLSLAQTGWQQPKDHPVLKGNDVHVWRVQMEESDKIVGELAELLSAKERGRFAQFKFATDRDGHTVVRGRLRQLIGKYLNVPARELIFEYAAHGKPFLPDYLELKFNVSHSGNLALIAFTLDQEIGVDLEVTDRSFAVDTIVSRFFSPQEIPVILGCPERQQHNAFYRAWTRKEAIIKAHGDGLSLPLSDFGVTIDLDDPVRVLHVDWAPEECGDWRLVSFMVGEEVPGAVAVKGELGSVAFLVERQE